jgi:3-methylfumaryl-CoA hydratase
LSPEELEGFADWIGREEITHGEISSELVRRFNATFNLIGSASEMGQVAPRLIHFCAALPAVPHSQLGADGHPKLGGFLPPLPLPHRMWAGGALRFHREIAIGDSIVRRSRISSIQAKNGKSGALCFVTVDHLIEASGHLAIEERQDLVYRKATRSSEPKQGPIEQRPAIDPASTLEITPTFLFRYSALTFNAHRIHYDHPYAKNVEQYPSLVVHGPLQATLLMNLAVERQGGVRPAEFEFRAVAPLFDAGPVHLFAEPHGRESMRLWTAVENGAQAMLATARWKA